MDYDAELDFMYDYSSTFNFIQTFNICCSFAGLRDRCVRIVTENIQRQFVVLSDIVTTWVDGRCVAHSLDVRMSEWDSMKRFIGAYIQATQNAKLLDEASFRGVVAFCGYKHVLRTSN